MGEGESITENTNTYGFLEFALNYGDPWDGERHQPYDRFDVAAQSNFGDKTRMGRLLIRGDLFTKPLGDGKHHSLALQQDFDYIDNEAYEYGGQSLGPALLSQFRPSSTLRLFTRLQAYAHPARGGELRLLRSSPTWPTRSGSGSTTTARAWAGRSSSTSSGRTCPSLTARYRYSYLNVSNGSIYNGETSSGAKIGLDSDHDVHQLNVKLEIPITRSLTIGADGSIFFRRSRYNITEDTPEFGEARRQTITQRNPEAPPLPGLDLQPLSRARLVRRRRSFHVLPPSPVPESGRAHPRRPRPGDRRGGPRRRPDRPAGQAPAPKAAPAAAAAGRGPCARPGRRRLAARGEDLGRHRSPLYQPQLDAWDGAKLSFYAAFAVREKPDANPLYGVVWGDGRTVVDKDSRLVTFSDRQIRRLVLPSAPDREKALLEGRERGGGAGRRARIALDRLAAMLEVAEADRATRALALKNDPPRIVFSYKSAILVTIDGEPVWRPVKDAKLERVLNTRVLVVRKGKDDLLPARLRRLDDGEEPGGAVDGGEEAAQGAAGGARRREGLRAGGPPHRRQPERREDPALAQAGGPLPRHRRRHDADRADRRSRAGRTSSPSRGPASPTCRTPPATSSAWPRTRSSTCSSPAAGSARTTFDGPWEYVGERRAARGLREDPRRQRRRRT